MSLFGCTHQRFLQEEDLSPGDRPFFCSHLAIPSEDYLPTETHRSSSSLHDDELEDSSPEHSLVHSTTSPVSVMPTRWATPVVFSHVVPSRLVAPGLPICQSRFQFAASSMRGARSRQEDAFHWDTLVTHTTNDNDDDGGTSPVSSIQMGATSPFQPPISYAAVFDGHGGDFASQFLADNLHHFIAQAPSMQRTQETSCGLSALASAMVEALRHSDAAILGQMRSLPSLESRNCGSTAVAACIQEQTLIVANLGDSRAVLSSCGGTVVTRLTRDHRADVSEEAQRIIQCGGQVENGRVRGDLAVSRAVGDFQYKCVSMSPSRQTESEQERLLSTCGGPLSNVADVTSYSISKSDDFVLLASDGLWDFISPEDAVQFVLARVGIRDNCASVMDDAAPAQCSTPRKSQFQLALDALVDHTVVELRSSDNVTVVGIRF